MQVITWTAVMQNAKEQGRLRMEGKFKEADELEARLQFIVKDCERMVIDIGEGI